MTKPAQQSDRQVISLNGAWRFARDAANIGKRQGWETCPDLAPDPTELPVPSVWQERFPGYDGVGWYWREFTAPERPSPSTALLHFAAVNYFAEVWLNGRYLGNHEGGYTPFDLDASSSLTPGVNWLAVRVLVPPKNEAGLDGIVLKETPSWRALESFNFGGIWQDVALLILPLCRLVDCFVHPRLAARSAEVHLEMANAALSPMSATLRVAIHEEGQAATVSTAHRHLALPPGVTHLTLTVAIENPQPWTPDRPFLYRADVVAETALGADALVVRFGMRELTLNDNGFSLNGERLFLKGAFHEGFYPISIAYHRDEAIVRKELQEAKAAGLNLLRFWQIPIHPRVLDLADEMGMLLMDEPPIEWISDSVHAERRCRQEVRDLVRRDRNHPSVAFWTILNEGGILPEFTRRGPAQFTVQEFVCSTVQRIRADLCREARALDPSRIVIDDSGGWYTGANAYLPDSDQPMPINDLHLYRRAPVDEQTYGEFAALGERDVARGRPRVLGGRPVFVTEFGYGSLPDFAEIIAGYQRAGARSDAEDFVQVRRIAADLDRVFREERLDDVFPSAAALCAATQQLQAEGNRLQMEALRANPRVAGYVVHAFSAGGVILCAEMVDIWRNPKPICRVAAEVHRTLYPVIRVWPRVVYRGRPLPIGVTVVSDRGALGPAVVEVSLVSAAGEQRIARQEAPITGMHTVVGRWDPIVRPETSGEARVRVVVSQDGAAVADAELPVMILPEPAWSTLPGAVRVIGAPGEHRDALRLAARGVTIDDAAPCTFVTAPPSAWRDERLAQRLRAALAVAEAGGVAFFLAPFDMSDKEAGRAFFPWLGEVRPALGSWIPVAHYQRAHPFFADLAGEGIAGWPFANVCPTHTLIATPAEETPAGSISLHATIFEKPERAWSGKDVIVRRHGRGRLVLSQYRLLEHFGADPIADQMLFNMLAWAQRAGEGPST